MSKNSQPDRMKMAMEVWLANPLDTFGEIAAKAGIGQKTFYRYRKDADFMEQYHKAQQERFAAMEGKAVALLDEEMNNRNWNAIKYVLDGNGYKPTDKVEVQQTTFTVGIEDD